MCDRRCCCRLCVCRVLFSQTEPGASGKLVVMWQHSWLEQEELMQYSSRGLTHHACREPGSVSDALTCTSSGGVCRLSWTPSTCRQARSAVCLLQAPASSHDMAVHLVAAGLGWLWVALSCRCLAIARGTHGCERLFASLLPALTPHFHEWSLIFDSN